MSAPKPNAEATCGCCAGVGLETPIAIANPPGLSSIGYRSGTYATFLASLQARLDRLPALTTRDPSDPTLALLDAFSSMAEVLTFYQERIANESYLRTATERRSLLELARLIGYELRPGVAAQTYLAFTLEDTPSSPPSTPVPLGARVNSVPGPGEKPQTFETREALTAYRELNALEPRQHALVPISATDTLYVVGTNTGLRPGDAILFAPASGAIDSAHAVFRTLAAVTPNPALGHTRLRLSSALVAPSGRALAQLSPFALKQRAALFGYNAPDWTALLATVQDQYTNAVVRAKTEARSQALAQVADWPGFSIDEIAEGAANTLYLDAIYPELVPGSYVVLAAGSHRGIFRVSANEDSARSGFTLSAKTTKLTLTGDAVGDFDDFVRETVVFARSEALTLAETPLDDPITQDIVLSRKLSSLAPGRRVILAGADAADGHERVELAEIQQVFEEDGLSGIRLASAVAAYARAGLAIYANVAPATNGETRAEVLGSGDATQAFQRFRLKQPPLTYVSDASASGAASTLEIYVDEVRWHEVPTLHAAGPDARVYVVRIQDDASGVIEFGDGRTGARLPTGVENVRAVYRRGIGLAGLVGAGQLTSAVTRPLGVKSVTNPLAATGAADPESSGDARQHAPRTVLTLGRVVSLQDYEDFSRSFAGIGKALATFTWDGARRGVFLTLAGPNGALVDATGDLGRNLRDALRAAGDPHVPLRLGSFRAARFFVRGKLKVDADHVLEQVQAAVLGALRAAFAFDVREFGAPVALSELLALVQAVDGVVAVDIDAFYRSDQSASVQARLPAAVPSVQLVLQGAAEVQGAELLMLELADSDFTVTR